MNAFSRIAALWIAFAAVSGFAAEEHGKTDAFAARGVALAWAVARGPSEASTFLVIRIVTDPGTYGALSVIGRDPFTGSEHAWLPATPTSGRMEVRIPRARHGDFPRTDLRFYGAMPASPTVAPQLHVFYLSVPDTTPEFDDAGRLDRYLEDRIAKARHAPGVSR